MDRIKRMLYFIVAGYFRVFARIRLSRWHPTIIVITASSGKTTLLHMLASQLGNRAKFSYHANSALGIPFDILDIHRKTLLRREWIGIFLKALFMAFASPPNEKLYIVEADCDRPGEGKFLGSFLKPHITVWLNVTRTHSMNFDRLVARGKYASVDAAIAHEFGYYIQFATDSVIINGDSSLL